MCSFGCAAVPYERPASVAGLFLIPAGPGGFEIESKYGVAVRVTTEPQPAPRIGPASMPMEGMETKEKTDDIVEHGRGRFNRRVAVAVVIVAVLMTLCKIKNEKIVEYMLAVQATELDQWNYYQSKSIKQHLHQLQVEQ
jgi:hypothetical protein